MEFHLAGKADDPAVADAEIVIEDLAMNLPDITLVSHIKDPEQWPQWAVELCQRMGFDESTYASGPIIWAAGRIVGDHSDLKVLTQRVYGRCQTKDYAELEILAQENLRLCKERDSLQAGRQERLKTLREEESALDGRIGTLTTRLEELGPQLDRAVSSWNEMTGKAGALVGQLSESGALSEALQSENPSRKLRKLVTLICRAMAPDSKEPVSVIINSSASATQMAKWLQLDPPSVLLSSGQDAASLARLVATLKRAATSLEQPSAAAAAKAPSKDPAVDSVQTADPEPALQLWCEAVVKLATWEGLSKFAEQLTIQQQAQAELVTSQENFTVLQQQVTQVEAEIEANSDKYDAAPAASVSLTSAVQEAVLT